MSAFTHQQPEQFVLNRIGVLHFVHQHVAQQALPLGAHLGIARQQQAGQGYEVIKVDRLVGLQALFVALHHTLGHALVVIGGLNLAALQALVLP